jgi:hypothetical protein
MQITLKNLQQKRAEYEKAYVDNLGLANANFGAMKAIDELIEEVKAEEIPEKVEATHD